MDVVGSVAALSQLAMYARCAVKALDHLHKTFQSAGFFAGSQLEEIHLLLKMLNRIEKRQSVADTDLLLPVLISIAETAQTLWSRSNPACSLRQKLYLIFHQADIEEAFTLLRQKYNLLVFYYSEQNNSTLNRIEASLNIHYHAVSASMSSSKNPDAPTSEDKLQHGFYSSLQRNETAPPHQGSNGSNADSTSALSQGPAPLTNQPLIGTHLGTFVGYGDEGQSRKDGQPKTKMNFSGNLSFQTEITTYNNTWRPDRPFEGNFTNNITQGGKIKHGNEEPNREPNEKVHGDGRW